LNPPVAEITPGLWRITLPLPFDLRQVHVHLLSLGPGEGWLLIDTGLNNEDNRAALQAGLAVAGIRLAEIRTILLTHTHPDHVGNSILLQRETGAKLLLHRREQELLHTIEQAPDTIIDGLLEAAGAPLEQARPTKEAFLVLRKSFRVQPAETLLEGGETFDTGLGRAEAIATPGHAPGHLCLYLRDRQILIAGDHVLPVITPVISWSPGDDNLERYLHSLDVIDACRGALALPSHGERIEDLTQRTQEIRQHHKKRCSLIAATLGDVEPTAHELVPFIWKRTLSPFNYRFALDEVLAHLAYLEGLQQVESRPVNGALRWRLSSHGG
jgi:glyoxylase-like metal-dependent hydrolase (beta-lactamase superfamily II)